MNTKCKTVERQGTAVLQSGLNGRAVALDSQGREPWYALAKHTNGVAVALALCCDVALGLPWSICWCALGLVSPANGRGLPFYSLGLTAEPWHWIARGVSPWYALAKHTTNGGAVPLPLFSGRCVVIALVDVLVRAGVELWGRALLTHRVHCFTDTLLPKETNMRRKPPEIRFDEEAVKERQRMDALIGCEVPLSLRYCLGPRPCLVAIDGDYALVQFPNGARMERVPLRDLVDDSGYWKR